MSGQTAKPFAGLNLADDLKAFEPEVTAPRPDPKVLAKVSERAGFPSREPQPAQPDKPAAPVRELNFDARLTLRVTNRDKQRFEDLAYRLRVPNGEAMQRLLDHFEATAQGDASD